MWDPGCRGAYCPNINWIRQKCKSENLNLIIVMEYFDCKQIDNFFDKKHPVIGIDTRYYKTNFTEAYRRKFLFDLTGIKNLDYSFGKFLFFQKSKYISEQPTL